MISVGNNSGLFIRELKKERKGGFVVASTPPVCVWIVSLLLRPLTAEPEHRRCTDVRSGPRAAAAVLIQHMAATVKSLPNRCFHCVKRIFVIFLKGKCCSSTSLVLCA